MAWFNKWYIAWPLSGVLLGIGFVVPVLWILGLVGGAYFLYLLQQATPWRQKIFGAWLAWSVKAAFAVWHLWSVYPIDWLPLDVGQIQLLLIFFTWFMTALCLGLGGVFLVLLVWLLGKHTTIKPAAYYVLIYPLLWLIGESLGSLALSVFFYGPGGTLNTSFSFGYVGYLIAEHDVLLQIARLAGVFALTYLFVLLAGLLLWMGQQKKKVQHTALALLAFMYLSGLVPIMQSVFEVPPSGYTVLTIDTQIRNSAAGQMEAETALTEAVAVALEHEPDYIILPEGSRYFDHSRSASAVKSSFKLQQGNSQVVLVDSSAASINGVTVQQAFVYNGPEDSTERFHKRFLVPQGEFFSSIYSHFLRSVGYSESLNYLSQGMSYRVGPWTDQSRAAANVPGILFCFESFAPRGVRTLVEERLEMPFVAHIASHAWFHEPHSLWSQMETMLQVQAVWNQQYIVSVGNMMRGKVYTPQGAVENMETLERGEKWEIKRVIIPR